MFNDPTLQRLERDLEEEREDIQKRASEERELRARHQNDVRRLNEELDDKIKNIERGNDRSDGKIRDLEQQIKRQREKLQEELDNRSREEQNKK